jgi:hypothetical protein
VTVPALPTGPATRRLGARSRLTARAGTRPLARALGPPLPTVPPFTVTRPSSRWAADRRPTTGDELPNPHAAAPSLVGRPAATHGGLRAPERAPREETRC